MDDFSNNRITRILTTDFPQYFAIITRIRQEVHAIGPEGGILSSTVVPQVQAIFPEGALTKKIKVGLQVGNDLVDNDGDGEKKANKSRRILNRLFCLKRCDCKTKNEKRKYFVDRKMIETKNAIENSANAVSDGLVSAANIHSQPIRNENPKLFKTIRNEDLGKNSTEIEPLDRKRNDSKVELWVLIKQNQPLYSSTESSDSNKNLDRSNDDNPIQSSSSLEYDDAVDSEPGDVISSPQNFSKQSNEIDVMNDDGGGLGLERKFSTPRNSILHIVNIRPAKNLITEDGFNPNDLERDSIKNTLKSDKTREKKLKKKPKLGKKFFKEKSNPQPQSPPPSSSNQSSRLIRLNQALASVPFRLFFPKIYRYSEFL